MKARHVAVIAVASLASVGCANWVNPRYATDAQAAQQFKIDKGRCKMAAAGSRPFPIPQSQPAVQTTSYQGQTYDWSGRQSGSYSGTATTTNNNAFGGGVADGFNTASSIMAANAQRDIYEGCLMNLGWRKK